MGIGRGNGGGAAAGVRLTREKAWLWQKSSWAEEAVGSGAVSLLSSAQLHGSTFHGHSVYSGPAMGKAGRQAVGGRGSRLEAERSCRDVTWAGRSGRA